jgi:hypothetical protein
MIRTCTVCARRLATKNNFTMWAKGMKKLCISECSRDGLVPLFEREDLCVWLQQAKYMQMERG